MLELGVLIGDFLEEGLDDAFALFLGTVLSGPSGL